MKTHAYLVMVGAIGCSAAVPVEEPTGLGTEDSTGTPGSTGQDSNGSGDESSGTGASATSSTGADDSGSESTSGGNPKFDVGGDDTTGEPGCGTDGGVPDFSYAWVTNGCLEAQDCPVSSVSKIDAETLTEVARYKTRPDGDGNPSRTSVNLNGDMAVANRLGGLTKIYARVEDCADANNTSSGPDDLKAWGDGCMAWHTPMAYTSQRAVAWTQGTFNEQTCTYEDTRVWTAGVANGQIEVVLVDGDSGAVLETVPVPEVAAGPFGIFGGAVDGEGNFWGAQLGSGSLVRVRLDDLSVDSWPVPIASYGMTVDSMGRPWVCSVQTARFDPATETFTIGDGNPLGGSGCMDDGNGRLWIAGRSVVSIDLESMTEVASYLVPTINGDLDTGYTRGISFDHEGYIWAPANWANRAYRVDPDTGEFTWVDGLQLPDTSSDMTGFGLSNAGVSAR